MSDPRTADGSPAPAVEDSPRERRGDAEWSAFRFGPFLLLPETLELERDGEPVAIAAQPARLLTLLAVRGGDVVSRQEIAELFWPDRVVEVDAGINAAVRQIRSALGESGSEPRYVETLPRIGYRMKAPVHSVRRPHVSGPSSAGTRFDRRTLPSLLMVAASVTLLLTGFSSWLVRSQAATPARLGPSPFEAADSEIAHGDVPRLAVLPTRDLSLDGSNAALASGLTEDLIAEIARLMRDHLEVIARTSSSQFGDEGDVRDADFASSVGSELGADYLLESSVRREGDRVRLTGQLVRVRDQRQQWAERFDRVSGSSLDLQLDLARAVANAIVPEILVDGPESGPALGWNPIAREDFLLGRYLVQNGSVEEGMIRLQRALEVDSSIGPAWIWLARAGGSHPDRWTPERRRNALQQALRVDSGQAEAHVDLGRLALYVDWDDDGAEAHYREALALDPTSSTVHHALAMLFGIRGSLADAVEHLDVARRLDPVSSLLLGDGAQILLMAGDLERAEQACRLVEELGRGAASAAQCFFDIALERDDIQEALSQADRLLAVRGAPEEVRGAVADAVRPPDARLRSFYSWSVGFLRDVGASPVAVADALLGTGNVDGAFEMLEVALAERRVDLLMVPSHPRARKYRDDPRLQSIVSRTGIRHVDVPVRSARLAAAE